MSATGTKGFTLLELLVVVAIIGLVISVAAVNLFPGDVEVARRETGRVAMALEGARDDAWFGGRPIAVSLEEAKVRVWRLRGDRTWEADTARDQAYGAPLRIASVHVDGQPLAPGERLVFLPDGLGVPFRVALEVRGLAQAIEGDAAGSIRRIEAAR